MKKNKKILLEKLLSGNITARQFLAEVRKPDFILAIVDATLPPGQEEPAPEAAVTLTLIGNGVQQRKQVTWKEYQKFQADNPDIQYCGPVVFYQSPKT